LLFFATILGYWIHNGEDVRNGTVAFHRPCHLSRDVRRSADGARRTPRRVNNPGIICSRTIGKPQVLLGELRSCAWCAAFCRIVFCVDLNPSAVPCGCPGDGWYAHWRTRPRLEQRIVEGDRGLARRPIGLGARFLTGRPT
jgi:hypothetical protein